MRRYAIQTFSSAKNRQIIKYDSNYFAEAKCYYSQIVTLQPQRRYAYQQTYYRRSYAADDESNRKQSSARVSGVQRYKRGKIRADRHESGMPQNKLTQKTCRKVQADRQDCVYTY